MRSLWLMPLTFVAGQHGFALFCPYLAAFLAAAHFSRERRKRAATSAAAPAESAAPVVAVAAA